MTRKIEVQPTVAEVAEAESAERAARKRSDFARAEGVSSKLPSEQQMFPQDANMDAPEAVTKEDYKKPGGARMTQYPNWVRQDS